MKNTDSIVRYLNKVKSKDSKDVVITFHNVIPEDFDWFKNTINMITQKFEVIDPKDIFSNKRASRKRVLITFDDGFKSNKKLEELFLKPKNIKAIFFITTDFLSLDESRAFKFVANNLYPKSSTAFLSNEKVREHFLPMNWIDLDNLINRGHTIGCHTKSHPCLSNLSLEQQKTEILESKALLENKLKTNIDHFAFPFGSPDSINSETLGIIRGEFKFNFCNVRGMLSESNNHLLYRQNITPGMPEWLIEDIINGKLNWLHYRKRLKLHNL